MTTNLAIVFSIALKSQKSIYFPSCQNRVVWFDCNRECTADVSVKEWMSDMIEFIFLNP